MITVRIPNNYIPERTYAIKTLLTHYCGVQVEIQPDDAIEHYELQWADKSLTIIDGFFGKFEAGATYAEKANVPKTIVESQSVGLYNILILFGEEQLEITREKIVCHVDLFAGVFFMLTRWEETIGEHKDLHNRFPANEALSVKEGFILRPIIDEYATLLKLWLGTLGYAVPLDKASFKIIPTCDVDMPFYWSSKPLWKVLGGRFRQHFNPIKLWRDYQNYRAVGALKKTDPYDTFEYLMTLAEKNKSLFQFYFLGGGKTKYEGYYQLQDPRIKALIEEIKSRGHALGLHPSYATYQDAEKIEEEKVTLEENSGMSITFSRQHFLRFSIPETWNQLAIAGISEDSTLGYAAEPGFRCGTCKPFPVFDIQQRKELPLMERPLLIMDVSLRHYKKLSVDENIALCEKIKSEVKKHNGEFIFLWHNSTLSEIGGWEGWKRVLESLIQE